MKHRYIREKTLKQKTVGRYIRISPLMETRSADISAIVWQGLTELYK